jgi:hypothetical protein
MRSSRKTELPTINSWQRLAGGSASTHFYRDENFLLVFLRYRGNNDPPLRKKTCSGTLVIRPMRACNNWIHPRNYFLCPSSLYCALFDDSLFTNEGLSGEGFAFVSVPARWGSSVQIIRYWTLCPSVTVSLPFSRLAASVAKYLPESHFKVFTARTNIHSISEYPYFATINRSDSNHKNPCFFQRNKTKLFLNIRSRNCLLFKLRKM